MLLDLETAGSCDDLEFRQVGRARVAGLPPTGCYALSALDDTIATSLLGARATFPCADETYYAISDADGAIATSDGGDRATFVH